MTGSFDGPSAEGHAQQLLSGHALLIQLQECRKVVESDGAHNRAMHARHCLCFAYVPERQVLARAATVDSDAAVGTAACKSDAASALQTVAIPATSLQAQCHARFSQQYADLSPDAWHQMQKGEPIQHCGAA